MKANDDSSWPQTVIEHRVHHRDSKKAPPTFSLKLLYSAARLRLIRGDECEIERTNMFVLITVRRHSPHTLVAKLLS